MKTRAMVLLIVLAAQASAQSLTIGSSVEGYLLETDDPSPTSATAEIVNAEAIFSQSEVFRNVRWDIAASFTITPSVPETLLVIDFIFTPLLGSGLAIIPSYTLFIDNMDVGSGFEITSFEALSGNTLPIQSTSFTSDSLSVVLEDRFQVVGATDLTAGFRVNTTPVPEHSSFALLLGGMALMLTALKRKNAIRRI